MFVKLSPYHLFGMGIFSIFLKNKNMELAYRYFILICTFPLRLIFKLLGFVALVIANMFNGIYEACNNIEYKIDESTFLYFKRRNSKL